MHPTDEIQRLTTDNLGCYLIRSISVAVVETGIDDHRPGYRHYVKWANVLIPAPPRARLPYVGMKT